MAALGFGQRAGARDGQVERLLARVARRALAAQEGARLQAVDDGHRRRPVHPQAPAELDLRDAGKLAHQPERRDLLLGEVEVGEGLGKVAIDRAVREADVEADDAAEAAQTGRPPVALTVPCRQSMPACPRARILVLRLA